MYKVFFNRSFLRIDSKAINDDCDKIVEFNENTNLQIIDDWCKKAEIGLNPYNLLIISDDPQKMWNTIIDYFNIIKAAGGIVFKEDKILLIFRRGKWDLPKGKVDDGETIEEAALREVSEETGLKELEISKKLTNTYHIYRLKGDLVIKETHWYIMNYLGNNDPVPQREEDIEKVIWASNEEIKTLQGEFFGTIRDVFKMIM